MYETLRHFGMKHRSPKERISAHVRSMRHHQESIPPGYSLSGRAVALPPFWAHKHHANVGDTVCLGCRNSIRVLVLSAKDDVDSVEGVVPISSPFGKALLGKSQGDRIALPTLDGSQQFTVLKII